MKEFFRAAPLALGALLLILAASAPALSQEPEGQAPAETEAATPADLPSAASELLSGVGGPETALPPAPADSGSETARADALQPAFAPRYGLDILRAFGMFILVIALLFLALKALGRFSRFRGRRGQASVFTMRGILPLDNRKYLAAVEVEGRLLVLGVTQDRITPLADWVPGRKTEHSPEDFSFRLREEEDLPPDISIADVRDGGSK